MKKFYAIADRRDELAAQIRGLHVFGRRMAAPSH